MLSLPQNLYLKLKDGGVALLYMCGTVKTEDQTFVNEIQGQEILNSVKEGGRNVPFKTSARLRGWEVSNYRWPLDEQKRVLLEGGGFKTVEEVNQEVDPFYEGDLDLKRFVNTNGRKIFIATK